MAVAKINARMGNGSGFGAVCGHENGGTEAVGSFANEAEDQFTAGGIEIASGFIGDEEFGGLDDGAGDGYTLHLAAGDLMRVDSGFIGEADPLEALHRDVRCVGRAGKQQGQLNIFENGEVGEELEKLKNEADRFAAKCGQVGFAEARGGASIDEDLAGGGEVHGAGQVEERAFAAAATAQESGDRAGLGSERDIIESLECVTVVRIFFRDVTEFQTGRGQTLLY
jgi:hypothetical protein